MTFKYLWYKKYLRKVKLIRVIDFQKRRNDMINNEKEMEFVHKALSSKGENIEKIVVDFITKEKMYNALLKMIKYHRERMDFESTCILVLQTLNMIHRIEEDLNGAAINTLVLRITSTTKILNGLDKRYSKLDIEMLDSVINNITQWLSDEE